MAQDDKNDQPGRLVGDRQDVVDVVNVMSVLIGGLVHFLDGQNLMPKERFAEWMRATAESMKIRVPDHPKGAERFDCFMLCNLADQIEGKKRAAWIPLVIPGGKA
jgi:hypothetical protein